MVSGEDVFSPTKEIWDRFRVCLCPPLPSGAKQALTETGRMEGWEKKFKDAVNWLGTVPSYCLTLAIALSHICELQLVARKGEAAEGRGCGYFAIYCISARKLQNASYLPCEPLEPSQKV